MSFHLLVSNFFLVEEEVWKWNFYILLILSSSEQSSEKAWLKAGPQQTLECRSLGLTSGCFGKSAHQEWLSSGFHCFSFIIHLIRENFKWAKGAHRSIFATHRICWTTIEKEKTPEKCERNIQKSTLQLFSREPIAEWSIMLWKRHFFFWSPEAMISIILHELNYFLSSFNVEIFPIDVYAIMSRLLPQ